MSKYTLNRVLWEGAAKPELARGIVEDPDTALATRDLSDAERAALGAADVRALFEMGVHPFLLYNFALRLAGRFSMEFVHEYLAQLEGLELRDLRT
ncbi:hypothetical protein GTR02_06785 [Kineococcus sp. R8]|uniref:hypothetical protein n=1 Tax=Kineococcus siccus TaxID=2696567 RepID=UPI001412C6B4|nr:hypothetical protein [Kineococcus siccus]NAZ81521.1 hypothetical protein [Kineococcus siccus]